MFSTLVLAPFQSHLVANMGQKRDAIVLEASIFKHFTVIVKRLTHIENSAYCFSSKTGGPLMSPTGLAVAHVQAACHYVRIYSPEAAYALDAGSPRL